MTATFGSQIAENARRGEEYARQEVQSKNEEIARLKAQLPSSEVQTELNRLKSQLAAQEVRYEKLRTWGNEQQAAKVLEQEAKVNALNERDTLKDRLDDVRVINKTLRSDLIAATVREAELKEKVGSLEAIVATSSSQFAEFDVDAYHNSDEFTMFDAENKTRFVRSFVKRLATKFPTSARAMVEATGLLLRRYFDGFYPNDTYPSEERDEPMTVDLPEFDAFDPAEFPPLN